MLNKIILVLLLTASSAFALGHGRQVPFKAPNPDYKLVYNFYFVKPDAPVFYIHYTAENEGPLKAESEAFVKTLTAALKSVGYVPSLLKDVPAEPGQFNLLVGSDLVYDPEKDAFVTDFGKMNLLFFASEAGKRVGPVLDKTVETGFDGNKLVGDIISFIGD